MGPNPALRDALNAIREQTVKEGKVYHQYVPVITDTTSIGEFASPILENTEVRNEFFTQLIKRIVYTSIEQKRFRNPLNFLEGERLPLGYSGQEIFVNPANGRQFNPNDFAGILQKYEADVKVQYTQVNMDIQYPVSITREKIRTAFVSWNSLNDFIDGLSNSLYNAAYIDQYRFTKLMVSNAYRENRVQIRTITAVTNEATAKAFTKEARALFLNFQSPSTAYNAWSKVGGEGRPVTTWVNPEDVVFLIRNDILANIDVDVLASAFHINNAKLMGRIIGVDNFDIYNDDGDKIYDGSAIVGLMADRSWFKIRQQDFAFDEFYNANNRSWNQYLNQVYMYNYSLFADAVVFATAEPAVDATAIAFESDTATVAADSTVELSVTTTPETANGEIAYTSSAETYATVAADPSDPKKAIITGVAEGSATITATLTNSDNTTVTDTVTVTVTAAPAGE